MSRKFHTNFFHLKRVKMKVRKSHKIPGSLENPFPRYKYRYTPIDLVGPPTVPGRVKETVFPYKCKQSVILILMVKYFISETSMVKKEENRPT